MNNDNEFIFQWNNKIDYSTKNDIIFQKKIFHMLDETFLDDEEATELYNFLQSPTNSHLLKKKENIIFLLNSLNNNKDKMVSNFLVKFSNIIDPLKNQEIYLTHGFPNLFFYSLEYPSFIKEEFKNKFILDWASKFDNTLNDYSNISPKEFKIYLNIIIQDQIIRDTIVSSLHLEKYVNPINDNKIDQQMIPFFEFIDNKIYSQLEQHKLSFYIKNLSPNKQIEIMSQLKPDICCNTFSREHASENSDIQNYLINRFSNDIDNLKKILKREPNFYNYLDKKIQKNFEVTSLGRPSFHTILDLFEENKIKKDESIFYFTLNQYQYYFKDKFNYNLNREQTISKFSEDISFFFFKNIPYIDNINPVLNLEKIKNLTKTYNKCIQNDFFKNNTQNQLIIYQKTDLMNSSELLNSNIEEKYEFLKLFLELPFVKSSENDKNSTIQSIAQEVFHSMQQNKIKIDTELVIKYINKNYDFSFLNKNIYSKKSIALNIAKKMDENYQDEKKLNISHIPPNIVLFFQKNNIDKDFYTFLYSSIQQQEILSKINQKEEPVEKNIKKTKKI